MANYNRVILAGRLTRDPEFGYSKSNIELCNVGLAVNSGKDRDKTMFIECVSFRKTAEIVKQWFTKGKPILVEGRLQFDRWEDRDGNRHSRHIVIVDSVSFIGKKDDNAADEPPASGLYESQPQAASSASGPPSPQSDDIPF